MEQLQITITVRETDDDGNPAGVADWIEQEWDEFLRFWRGFKEFDLRRESATVLVLDQKAGREAWISEAWENADAIMNHVWNDCPLEVIHPITSVNVTRIIPETLEV